MLTGRQLFEIHREAMDSLGIGSDTWDDFDEADHTVWDRFAELLNLEVHGWR